MLHALSRTYRHLRLRSLSAAAAGIAFAACDDNELLEPETGSLQQEEVAAAPVEAPAPVLRQAGGIPIGMAAQPVTEFGDVFSGAKLTVGPAEVLSRLSAVRARGGRVVLMFAGNPRYYTDSRGHFSLSKWKDRVDRFKRINLDSYINDGTIAGHYMIDEPNDKANWNGTTVSISTLEEMGRHSKQLWPKMATIVRTRPDYFTRTPRHVDAAWATYLSRHGNPRDFIRRNVANAQKRNLELVVGLNVLRGGTPKGSKMTASEVESWGSALLSSSYPCGFYSWTYNNNYLSSRSMKSAMKTLRQKAENRSRKSCRR